VEKEKKEKGKTNKAKASKAAAMGAVETVVRRVGCEVEIEMVANFDLNQPESEGDGAAHRLFVSNLSANSEIKLAHDYHNSGRDGRRSAFPNTTTTSRPFNVLNRVHYAEAKVNSSLDPCYEDYDERKTAAIPLEEVQGVRASPSFLAKNAPVRSITGGADEDTQARNAEYRRKLTSQGEGKAADQEAGQEASTGEVRQTSASDWVGEGYVLARL